MLASLIASFASGETVMVARRARRAAIAYVLAGAAALCGAGFLVGALYIWAAQRYGGLQTSLGFGGGFLLLAILILLIHKLTATSRARRAAERRKVDMTAIGVAATLAALPTLLRGKNGGLGLGALLGPAIALAAYAIYRENFGSEPDEPDQTGES